LFVANFCKTSKSFNQDVCNKKNDM
ncbi:uncharacterized protein METZ01_LOCUS325838, partial [marine metagenome]